MRNKWLLIGIALLTAVLALGAVACEDDDDGDGNGAVATATTASDGGDATGTEAMDDETPQVAASVEITAPADGDTVTSPVTLEVSATGIEIGAAADLIEGAGHFHAFVDQEPVAEGESVPQETEGIFHFAAESQELELEPGEHTVTVVLGDNTHIRLADVPAATVTFTVE
ncbi:MAG: DUF4399 domain-containing protein [Dehalococcoidia bacterium]